MQHPYLVHNINTNLHCLGNTSSNNTVSPCLQQATHLPHFSDCSSVGVAYTQADEQTPSQPLYPFPCEAVGSLMHHRHSQEQTPKETLHHHSRNTLMTSSYCNRTSRHCPYHTQVVAWRQTVRAQPRAMHNISLARGPGQCSCIAVLSLRRASCC